MRANLDELQRAADTDQGKITGLDGRAYSRHSTKTKRKVCDDLVAAGTPLVLEMFSRGQFEWLDGEDATKAWMDLRPYVISSEPTTQQLAKHEVWTAGIWEVDEGTTALHLTGHC